MIYHNLGFSDNGIDDLRVPLTSARVPTAAPPDFTQIQTDGSGSTGVFAHLFDKTTEQQLYFETQMPHDWANGTTIYPHIHWCGVDTEASVSVSWGLEYVITSIHGTIGNTTIIYGCVPVSGDTGVTALKHQITNLGAGIDMSAYTGVSAIITGRVFRNVSAAGTAQTDDYDDDAAGLSLDFHYTRWRLGSPTVSG